tara:strand:+ start:307 stop:510 length:204 start_codon:yes stop_codon:yes gene_type:complete
MLKLLLLSIGLLLVFEGLMYFVFATNLNKFMQQLSKIDPQIIKSFSIFAIGIGSCLIYFTMRFYGEY